MTVNNWNRKQVQHAERSWGHLFPQYTTDAFDFLINKSNSFLDLGCGFGRFLEYLSTRFIRPNYIGYDSSRSMIRRIRRRFPSFSNNVFLRNITDPIIHFQQTVLVNAVLIHLTLEDQKTLLTNISNLSPSPLAISFDINSPSNRSKYYEKITKKGFRMTWQSRQIMEEFVKSLFTPQYEVSYKTYLFPFKGLNRQGRKVVFFLNKINETVNHHI